MTTFDSTTEAENFETTPFDSALPSVKPKLNRPAKKTDVPIGMKTKILFVCMGNICRSPTAQGVFQSLVKAANLQDFVVSDSAGTHDFHVGEHRVFRRWRRRPRPGVPDWAPDEE